MKKTVAVTIFLFAVVVSGIFGQAQDRMPDLKTYFMLANQLKSPEWDFKKSPFLGDDPADSDRFSNLTGNLKAIDSYLEFALLTYYSVAEKPWAERGNTVLPLNNPRLVDRQLGAAVFQEIQVLRFLGDTAAVSRHEAVLKFITDRNNATRAEIEAFYRDNVRALIAGVVDEEFNKISFPLRNLSADRTYNSVLTRNQTGGYILSYERPEIQNSRKELTAKTLEALLAEMRKNTTDFVQADIDTVRAQAALIPAVGYETNGNSTLGSLKNILTDFYVNPIQKNYDRIVDMRNIYRVTQGYKEFEAIYASFRNTLTSLHPALAEKISSRGTPGA